MPHCFYQEIKKDVKEAIDHDFAAGYVSETDYTDDEADNELRMTFDFDAVLVDYAFFLGGMNKGDVLDSL